MNEQENNSKNRDIETYAETMAHAAESARGADIKAIIEQESLYEDVKKQTSPELLKNKIFLGAGILLLVSAIALLGYFISTRGKSRAVDVLPQFVPAVFTEETAFIEVSELDRKEVGKEVVLEAQRGGGEERIFKGIYLTENEKVIGWADFLRIIESDFAEKSASFGEGFLLGAVDSPEKDVFILLEARSFAEAFDAMKVWEEKIFSELYDFFGYALSEGNRYLLSKDFENTVVENKNSRVLYDEGGNPALLYVFSGERFVIIASSEEAVERVLAALSGK